MDAVDLVVAYWPYLVVGLLLLLLLIESVAIAGGDEFLTLERRWFGKPMADGRTIALHDEVGVQARTLGPGVHFLVPFMFGVKKHRFLTIGPGQIGVVRAITGVPMPLLQYLTGREALPVKRANEG